MKPNEEAVREFREIYKKKFGLVLDEEGGGMMSELLLNAYKVVYGSLYNDSGIGEVDVRKHQSE